MPQGAYHFMSCKPFSSPEIVVSFDQVVCYTNYAEWLVGREQSQAESENVLFIMCGYVCAASEGLAKDFI